MKQHLPTTLITGGRLEQTNSAITAYFDEIRYSISTGQLNGGLHHTMAVRSQKLTFHIDSEKDLPGGSISEYLSEEFQQVDIPIHFATGLLTSASMEKAVYICKQANNTIVEVIATGGFDQTAHRAGNGYFYEEKNGEYISCKERPIAGTINLLIFTNKALTDGALTRALISITEAKTASLIDAKIASCHDSALATGTATDGIIMTIDPNGDILTDSGTFSLFGDTLAKAVKEAVYQLAINDHPSH